MKNEIKITELRTLDLKLSENELGLLVVLRNAYGEWGTACQLEISNPEKMMGVIFEHVLRIQGSMRASSGYKGFILGIMRRVKDEIVDREETIEKAGLFFDKFMQAKENYKNNKLGEEELRLLETEEMDFEDENLGALNMSGAERMVYFVQRARAFMEDMPYISVDDLERIFELDAGIGLKKKYLGRLKGIRDVDIVDMELISSIEALIKDIENDLERAGYNLEIRSKYTVSEEGDVIETGGELEPMKDLLLPDSARTTPTAIKKGQEKEYTDLLFAIEGAIASFYRENPEIKDSDVINALKNLKRGLTKKYPDGCLEDMIQLRIRLILSYKSRTKSEVQICLAYVVKSVKVHRRVDGIRGYLNFIIDYA